MAWSSDWAADRPPRSRSRPWRRASRRACASLAIPSSGTTAALARRLGVPLTSFAEHRRIDVTIDGADQVERGTLNLVKGLGGALLREKIVASASDRMIVVVDETKLVDRLGGKRRCLSNRLFRLADRARSPVGARLRAATALAGDKPFRTDGGNYIVDCGIAEIPDPAALEARLSAIIGVVESGLLHRPGIQDRRRWADRRGGDREMKDVNADRAPAHRNGPRTLAIDVGGTGLKASILDQADKMLVDRIRVATPYPCPPKVPHTYARGSGRAVPRFRSNFRGISWRGA